MTDRQISHATRLVRNRHAIEPIYPPSRHVLPKACADCGEDVLCDKGFAILDEKPGTYLCFSCACLYSWSPAKRLASMLEDYWKKYGPLR